MRIDDREIRSGVNDEITIGAVSEYNIKIKECERKCVIDDVETTVKSAWIGGSIVVKVNGNDVTHKFGYNDTIRHKKNGDTNKSFESILTTLGYNVSYNADTKKLEYSANGRTLVPMIKSVITWIDLDGNEKTVEINGDAQNATRLKITSRLSLSRVLNKDETDLNVYDDYPIIYLSTSDIPTEDSAKFTVEGVITDVAKELNPTSGNETGRYLVDVAVVDFFGVEVYTLIMEDKWSNEIDGEVFEVTKEDFYVENSEDSFCKLGDTVKLSGEVIGRVIGSVQTEKAKKTFGGGSQSMKSGYTKLERVIKSGDIVDAEPYASDDIQWGLNEREIIIDNEFKRQKEAKANNKEVKSPKGASNSATAPNPFNKNNASTTQQNPFAKKNPFAK